MRELWGFAGWVLVGIVGALALIWVLTGNEFFMYRYFAPKQEAVRRQVFEQTKSYRQGMIQELYNMQRQYIVADDNHKDALASVILHQVADFPDDDLPTDLRVFIQQLRSGQ